jgi:ubiquitin-like modifier-activating enzyme ATG7
VSPLTLKVSEVQLNDLTKVFDPTHLAESAIGLNLKLMKWRMAPDIDLEVIKG